MPMDESELLELNAELMILIREKQEKGALNDAISLQILLHKNLMRLRQYMINPQLPIPDAPKAWKPPPPRAQPLPSGDAESTSRAQGKQSQDGRGSCSKNRGEKRPRRLLQHRQRQQQPLLSKRPRRETKRTRATTRSRPGQGQGRAAGDSTSGRESRHGEDGQEQQAEAAPERTVQSGASREDSTRHKRLQEGQGIAQEPTPGGQGARSEQASSPPQQQEQDSGTSQPAARPQMRYAKFKPSREERGLEKPKIFNTAPKKRLEPRLFQPPPLFAPPWMASVPAGSLVGPFPPGPFGLSIPPGVGNISPIPNPLRLPAVTCRASKSSAEEQGPGPATIDRRGIGVKDHSQQEDSGQSGAGAGTGCVEALAAGVARKEGRRKDRPTESGRELEAADGEGLRKARSRLLRSSAGGVRGEWSSSGYGEQERDQRSSPPRPLPPSNDGGNEQLGPDDRLGMLLNVGMLQAQRPQHVQGHVPLVAPEERGRSLGAPPYSGAPTSPPPAPLPLRDEVGDDDDDDDQDENNRSLPRGSSSSLLGRDDGGGEDVLRGASPAAREPNPTIDAQPWMRRGVQQPEDVAA